MLILNALQLQTEDTRPFPSGYLTRDELEVLGRIVKTYLPPAEDRGLRTQNGIMSKSIPVGISLQ